MGTPYHLFDNNSHCCIEQSSFTELSYLMIFRLDFIQGTSAASRHHPESPDHNRAMPKLSVVNSPIVTIEPVPEFLTNGCSRPLCGNSCQKAKLVPTIKPAPMIAIIRVFLSTQ